MFKELLTCTRVLRERLESEDITAEEEITQIVALCINVCLSGFQSGLFNELLTCTRVLRERLESEDITAEDEIMGERGFQGGNIQRREEVC